MNAGESELPSILAKWIEHQPRSSVPVDDAAKVLSKQLFETFLYIWNKSAAIGISTDVGGILQTSAKIQPQSEGLLKFADFLQRVVCRSNRALREQTKGAVISREDLFVLLASNFRRMLGPKPCAHIPGAPELGDLIFRQIHMALYDEPALRAKWDQACLSEPEPLHPYLTEVSQIALGWDHARPVPLRHFKREALFGFLDDVCTLTSQDPVALRSFKIDVIGPRGLGLRAAKPFAVIGWDKARIYIDEREWKARGCSDRDIEDLQSRTRRMITVRH